jgi:hypothetical protein
MPMSFNRTPIRAPASGRLARTAEVGPGAVPALGTRPGPDRGSRHPEESPCSRRVSAEVGRSAVVHDSPTVEDVDIVRELESQARVLLDQQDRQACGPQRPQLLPELLDQQWREALRRLIHQQERRIGHEGPTDGKHLLLAAAERPGQAALTLEQAWEEAEDPAEIPAGVAIRPRLASRDRQILDARKRAKDVSSLWHEADPKAGDLVRRESHQVAPTEPHAAMVHSGWRGPHDGPDEARLARAIPPEERDQLALFHPQRNASQNRSHPIVAVEVRNLQHRAIGPAIGLCYPGALPRPIGTAHPAAPR